MSSGVKCDSASVATYQELKLGRKFQAIFYHIDASSEIKVEKTIPAGTSFDAIINEIPKQQARYIVLDFAYEDEGANKSKICFVAWCPDTAPIKQKMLYTSSKDSLRKALVGIQVEIQGTDESEINHQSFIEKVKKI